MAMAAVRLLPDALVSMPKVPCHTLQVLRRLSWEVAVIGNASRGRWHGARVAHCAPSQCQASHLVVGSTSHPSPMTVLFSGSSSWQRHCLRCSRPGEMLNRIVNKPDRRQDFGNRICGVERVERHRFERRECSLKHMTVSVPVIKKERGVQLCCLVDRDNLLMCGAGETDEKVENSLVLHETLLFRNVVREIRNSYRDQKRQKRTYRLHPRSPLTAGHAGYRPAVNPQQAVVRRGLHFRPSKCGVVILLALDLSGSP